MNNDMKNTLRNDLNLARKGADGGTNMYHALQEALTSVERRPNINDCDTYLVVLTDGESHDSAQLVEHRFRTSSNKLHVIIIGINLLKTLFMVRNIIIGFKMVMLTRQFL